MSVIMQLVDWRIRRESVVDIGPINLALSPGEICTLMGPSGIGKTTLLLSALGYRQPGLLIEGKRYQGGQALAPGAIYDSALYIPQRVPFNPNWEIQAFLCRLPWELRSPLDTLFPTRSKRLKHVQEVLRRLDLEMRARATLSELSGGESQRAAVAQLFLLKPEIFVGDEFLSGLDPGVMSWLLDECKRSISRRRGVALLASHDVHSALRVSDRILLIWPPNVETLPWQIIRNVSWRADLLYALLCITRWVKDQRITTGMNALIRTLQPWLIEGQLLNECLANAKSDSCWEIHPNGSICLASPEVEAAWAEERLLWKHDEIVPLRFSLREGTAIGIAAPVHGREHRVALISCC